MRDSCATGKKKKKKGKTEGKSNLWATIALEKGYGKFRIRGISEAGWGARRGG